MLTKEFERAKRYGTPVSLIMLDIDHFKKVNDNYGHQAGDTVLREVSKVIMKGIREIDTASRYGGEEFMVILPNTERENARVGAERMRSGISQHAFPEIEGPITVSIGVAGLPDPAIESEDRLIRCVDHALYRAKQNGRNCIEIAAGTELEESF